MHFFHFCNKNIIMKKKNEKSFFISQQRVLMSIEKNSEKLNVLTMNNGDFHTTSQCHSIMCSVDLFFKSFKIHHLGTFNKK